MNDYSAVPDYLKAQTRFVAWCLKDSKKPPCDDAGFPLADWQNNLLTFEQARARVAGLPFPEFSPKGDRNAGIGLVHATGIDLDNAVTYADGKPIIDVRAQVVVDMTPGWVEFSPSGCGLKIYCQVEPPRWLELDFREQGPPKCESKSPLYFAMTGREYRAGDPSADGTKALALAESMFAASTSKRANNPRKKKALDAEGAPVQPGGQEAAMFREACRLRHMGWQEPEIAQALWGLIVSGRFPSEPGKQPWTFSDCEQKARSAARYEAGEAPPAELERNRDGVVVKSYVNLARVIEALGVTLAYDEFYDRKIMARDDGKLKPVDDDDLNKLRFEIETRWKLVFGKDMFMDAVAVIAKENRVHPVREYLAGLEWDGVGRIGKWLVTYGGADDTAFVRAAGRLSLIAAVTRVHNPGAKFDEMLVLESPQGFEKSTAIRALCPDQEWFTDTLPLGSDAKITIERTRGVWIVEAAEMHGYGRKEVEHLKTFLSTQRDGPVRGAYARESVAKERQFIVVGTTNQEQYLRDAENRRFWPIRVKRFDVAGIVKDREQLWAEAMQAFKQGESIRMPRDLWSHAGAEQEARRAVDPWRELLSEQFGEEKPGRVMTRDIWDILDVEPGRRTQFDSDRLSATMRALGFEKRKLRDATGDTVAAGFVRGLGNKNPRELVWLAGKDVGKVEQRQPGEDEVPF